MPNPTFDRTLLEKELTRDEGLRLRPYRDTVGKETIGIGHNLTDLGISVGVAQFLLADDLYGGGEGSAKVVVALSNALPWVWTLPPGVQRAVVNITYNIGLAGLLGFHNALARLQAHDYSGAANAFLASRWAAQVGARAVRLTNLIRAGV